ncbi:Transposon Ty3-I Gag-Pol polyprotein [Vitis vinifera]|uniref:Transposon Ty3-I Gag-Pol polyprotein n=1 Tax=Vitis vinifera TaxID=29760 RepID=A0A438CSN8_VITVI|nr:Transposon Ty3-I Gag-Pol polyprotein [Vitis vinifera]
MDLLRKGLQHDPVAKSHIALAHEGKTKRFGWRMTYSTLRGDNSTWLIEAYVRTCLVCQQDKVEQRQPRGLLEPLPIAEHSWDSVTMDFIIGLPKSEDNDSIIVVVDRFSKYATFIAAPTDCTAEETTRLFLKHTKLFKLMGSEFHFSTSFHPQTDGKTERVNALLELYLRHFVSANQKDWAKLLDIA